MSAPPLFGKRFLPTVRKLILDIISSRIPTDPPPPVLISLPDLTTLIAAVVDRHQREPATLTLTGPHYIVGDIHGNVDALIRIFGQFGFPPHSQYLFLGDYIDRGRNSCEVILILYGLKTLFPDHIHLLRGNHEFFGMSDAYGFRRECEYRLSRALYEQIIRSFDSLPIAARIGGNYCVHGGLSPKLMTEHAIPTVEKLSQKVSFLDSPSCEMLWSDPSPSVAEFAKSPRGFGVLFGRDAVTKFLAACPGAFRIVRSHESCQAGFNWPFSEGGPVLTVFSSCDYCNMGNYAGVVTVTDGDNSVKCQAIPPVGTADARKRRVIYPEWLMKETGMVRLESVDELANLDIDV
jgi:diadenosine tetraphosphatase ApaH/serine/threonine PP2A family protein phosphatase